MADRFVLVSTRKWRDPWYRRLEPEQRHVWDYLTEYPDETQTGIIERLPEDMAEECQTELSAFQGALDRFETDGRILREGEIFLFVIKWLKHQLRRKEIKWIPDENKKEDNRTIAINLELERLRDKCPMLVAAFDEFYKGIKSPHEGATEGLGYINTTINTNTKINNNTTNAVNSTNLADSQGGKTKPKKPNKLQSLVHKLPNRTKVRIRGGEYNCQDMWWGIMRSEHFKQTNKEDGKLKIVATHWLLKQIRDRGWVEYSLLRGLHIAWVKSCWSNQWIINAVENPGAVMSDKEYDEFKQDLRGSIALSQANGGKA